MPILTAVQATSCLAPVKTEQSWEGVCLESGVLLRSPGSTGQACTRTPTSRGHSKLFVRMKNQEVHHVKKKFWLKGDGLSLPKLMDRLILTPLNDQSWNLDQQLVFVLETNLACLN